MWKLNLHGFGHIRNFHITHNMKTFSLPPTFCRTDYCFQFKLSWEHAVFPRDSLKTIGYEKLGGQTKCTILNFNGIYTGQLDRLPVLGLKYTRFKKRYRCRVQSNKRQAKNKKTNKQTNKQKTSVKPRPKWMLVCVGKLFKSDIFSMEHARENVHIL